MPRISLADAAEVAIVQRPLTLPIAAAPALLGMVSATLELSPVGCSTARAAILFSQPLSLLVIATCTSASSPTDPGADGAKKPRVSDEAAWHDLASRGSELDCSLDEHGFLVVPHATVLGRSSGSASGTKGGGDTPGSLCMLTASTRELTWGPRSRFRRLLTALPAIGASRWLDVPLRRRGGSGFCAGSREAEVECTTRGCENSVSAAGSPWPKNSKPALRRSSISEGCMAGATGTKLSPIPARSVSRIRSAAHMRTNSCFVCRRPGAKKDTREAVPHGARGAPPVRVDVEGRTAVPPPCGLRSIGRKHASRNGS